MEGQRTLKMLMKDGAALQVTFKGPEDGVPVLLLHGYSDSAHTFHFLLQRENQGMRFIIPDLRGHGKSDKPDGAMPIAQFASDVTYMMDQLGLSSTVLVGHSMGSLVAQKIAADHPDRVKALGLMASAASCTSNDILLSIRADIEALTDPVDPDFVRDFQTPDTPVDQSFMAGVMAASLSVPAHVWKNAFHGILETDHTNILSKINCPTRLFWGKGDVIFNQTEQDKILTLIKGSSLVAFNGGHAFHWEQPEAFAAQFSIFLAEVALPRPAYNTSLSPRVAEKPHA